MRRSILPTKEYWENWYKKIDPWEYQTTPADLKRKAEVITALQEVNKFEIYNRALDIGCGEGFVTESLPADEIHGIEVSDLAASRFPSNIIRVHEPQGKYDLIATMGTMYKDYPYKQFEEWIKHYATRHVLIAGIKSWLVECNFGKVIFEKEFSYRQYTQRIIIYEVST